MKRLLILSFTLLLIVDSAFAEEERVNLVSEMQSKYQLSPQQAAEQLERVFSLLREKLKLGKTVEVRSFGKFNVRERKVRQKKKEGVQGPPPEVKTKKHIHFLAAESFKEDINS